MQPTDCELFTFKAWQALEFARLHDWGDEATLAHDHAGKEIVVGLKDAYTTPDGTLVVDDATMPATITALRVFGGY